MSEELDIMNLPMMDQSVELSSLVTGTYKCECMDVKALPKKNSKSKYNLITEFEIVDPNSDFFGEKLVKFLTIYPGVKFDTLSPEEKKDFRNDGKYLNAWLEMVGFSSIGAFTPQAYKEHMLGKEAWIDIYVNDNSNFPKFNKYQLVGSEGISSGTTGSDFDF